MPFKYEIIESKKLLYAKAIGEVTFSELMNHLDELCQDSKYKAPMKKLVDHRQIERLDLTMKEQELLAEKKASFRELFSGEKCAIAAALQSRRQNRLRFYRFDSTDRGSGPLLEKSPKNPAGDKGYSGRHGW